MEIDDTTAKMQIASFSVSDQSFPLVILIMMSALLISHQKLSGFVKVNLKNEYDPYSPYVIVYPTIWIDFNISIHKSNCVKFAEF